MQRIAAAEARKAELAAEVVAAHETAAELLATSESRASQVRFLMADVDAHVVAASEASSVQTAAAAGSSAARAELAWRGTDGADASANPPAPELADALAELETASHEEELLAAELARLEAEAPWTVVAESGDGTPADAQDEDDATNGDRSGRGARDSLPTTDLPRRKKGQKPKRAGTSGGGTGGGGKGSTGGGGKAAKAGITPEERALAELSLANEQLRAIAEAAEEAVSASALVSAAERNARAERDRIASAETRIASAAAELRSGSERTSGRLLASSEQLGGAASEIERIGMSLERHKAPSRTPSSKAAKATAAQGGGADSTEAEAERSAAALGERVRASVRWLAIEATASSNALADMEAANAELRDATTALAASTEHAGALRDAVGRFDPHLVARAHIKAELRSDSEENEEEDEDEDEKEAEVDDTSVGRGQAPSGHDDSAGRQGAGEGATAAPAADGQVGRASEAVVAAAVADEAAAAVERQAAAEELNLASAAAAAAEAPELSRPVRRKRRSAHATGEGAPSCEQPPSAADAELLRLEYARLYAHMMLLRRELKGTRAQTRRSKLTDAHARLKLIVGKSVLTLAAVDVAQASADERLAFIHSLMMVRARSLPSRSAPRACAFGSSRAIPWSAPDRGHQGCRKGCMPQGWYLGMQTAMPLDGIPDARYLPPLRAPPDARARAGPPPRSLPHPTAIHRPLRAPCARSPLAMRPRAGQRPSTAGTTRPSSRCRRTASSRASCSCSRSRRTGGALAFSTSSATSLRSSWMGSGWSRGRRRRRRRRRGCGKGTSLCVSVRARTRLQAWLLRSTAPISSHSS
jgi:hypothetical protein